MTQPFEGRESGAQEPAKLMDIAKLRGALCLSVTKRSPERRVVARSNASGHGENAPK